MPIFSMMWVLWVDIEVFLTALFNVSQLLHPLGHVEVLFFFIPVTHCHLIPQPHLLQLMAILHKWII